ncbi:MarR-like DNA-binding transcriptional regulator SgrR of sgrS sRNA [Filibacter limicola]|uniref:MarR-like DNA-binding transcriptional regulator SgrR of sgrS sRNA n=1 Tax=Sporosarcina limicola TaxID=34101 RepID=A0A927RFK5_9BACL|nr:MarR-like DNA-binding transcriptional regulator SgrR of sgrS sRNA [Sporosarcina limicola]
MPIEFFKRSEEFKTHSIGCGPFQLIRHDENMIRLDVFPNYYGERPWLDHVEIIKIPLSIHSETKHPLLLRAPDTSWNEVLIQEEGATFIAFNCYKQLELH